MEADRSTPSRSILDRVTPAGIVQYALLGSVAAKMLSSKIFDPDLWWHLQTGELIFADRAIPRTDPFSYTAPGRPWVVQEWGSEVILEGLRKMFGLYGILFYRAVMLVIVYALVARLLRRRMGTGMTAAALLALTAYGGAPNWTERPNLMSFALFVLTLLLLERRESRALWWFVPLAVVWANLHGMVILGIGLLAVVAATEWLKLAFSWEGADRARARTVSVVALAGLGASLLNPAGFGLIRHALHLTRTVGDFVSEWGSPNFHRPGPLIFLTLVLITVAALAFNPSRPDPTDVALFLAFTFLGLYAARNLAVAAIVIGATCARWLPGALASVSRREQREPRPAVRTSGVLNLAGIAMATIGLGVVMVAGFPPSDDVHVIVEDTYPVATIDSLRSSGVRVFAYDAWAGMVIDRAWPQAKVYIDLRWDFYGTKLSNQYGLIVDGTDRARELLDEECTTHVLVPPRGALSHILSLAPQWRQVRRDDTVALFARREPAQGCEEFPIPTLG